MANHYFPETHSEHDSEQLLDGDESTDDATRLDATADGPIGGGENPAELARRTDRRRAVKYLIAAGVAVVLMLTFARGGRRSAKRVSPTVVGRVDKAVSPTTPKSRQSLADTDLFRTGDAGRLPGEAPPSGAADWLDPNGADAAGGSAGKRRATSYDPSARGGLVPGDLADQGMNRGSRTGGVDERGLGAGPQNGSPVPGRPYQPLPGQSISTLGQSGDSARAAQIPVVSAREQARQAALDAERRTAVAAAAAHDERERRRKAEEQRLKTMPFVIASNSESEHTSTASPERGADTAVDHVPPAGPASTRPAILPESQVSAVTISTFVSDARGTGKVAARLTSALKDKDGNVVLPVGTRAFGDAQAAPPVTGRPAQVQVTFNVFVTEDKREIRGLTGYAADPTTLATSVRGRADYRFLDRALRGAASTAVTLALTAPTRHDQVSVLSVPNPYDQAMNQGAQRAASIIDGPIGDENSVPPAVTLAQGTEIAIVFGLNP